MPPPYLDPSDLPIGSSRPSATEEAEQAAPGSLLAARREELAETRALVDATEATSPEHERFLNYLNALAGWLQALYDEGDAEGDLAEVFHQGLRAFVPLVDCDWLSLRPPGLVELDEEDRELLQVIRRQRRVFKSREPPTPEGTMLVNLLIMTLEAIEIYIIARYGDGREACMNLWMAVARLVGCQVDSL